MPTLSAFADEISPDPQIQMDTMEANGVKFIELRGANGLNVMKFPKEMCAELRKRFSDRGFGVSCIGSPIGKARLDQDWNEHFDLFKHACDLAEYFGSRYIRIFSYYPPEGQDIANFRLEVLRRMDEKLAYIKNRPITLVLENESNLFGALPERCVYLFTALNSPQMVAAFDPGNFVNMNCENVHATCWRPLRKYVKYFHIKDFTYAGGTAAVPAGQGDGHIPEILKDAAADGYDGFLALEPHLARAEHSTGHTPPPLFKVAVDALRQICANVGWRV